MQLDIEPNLLEQKIGYQRIKSLCHYLYISQPVNIVCAILVFLILSPISNPWGLSIWLGACIIISLIRLSLSRWHLRPTPNYRLHLRILVLNTAISAAIWGILGSLLMPPHDIFKQTIIIIIITGITAGGLQTLQASFFAGLCFILFAVVPLELWVLLQTHPTYKLLGFLIFIYISSMSLIAFRNFKIFSEILNLRYENYNLITTLENINNKLKYLSTHDSLTGLPNRVLFEELFTTAIENSQKLRTKFAVLFVDIDHFKSYNDTYGHDIGDSLLIQTANRITKVMRKEDIIARVGGDEFVILIENIKTKEQLEIIMQKILQQFADSFFLNGRRISTTFSIGISIYPDDGNEKKALLKAADIALYNAKRLGRNRYEYFQK